MDMKAILEAVSLILCSNLDVTANCVLCFLVDFKTFSITLI
jgi:hypothetical protein